MISQRAEASICLAVSIPAAAAYPWNHTIGAFGAVMFAFSAFSLVRGLRRNPEQRAQEKAIRHLHSQLRRLPTGRTWQDPDTGRRFTVEKRRGFTTLLALDAPGPDATASRYRVTWRGFPSPPPVLKHTAAADDHAAADVGFTTLARMADFNKRYGLMEASSAELAALQEELDRALAAPSS